MPEVMIRRNDAGTLVFYVAKKDLEETITSLEHEGPEQWGGEVVLGDGSRYYIDPRDVPARLPITVRAKRL